MKTSSILIMVLAAGSLGAQEAPRLDGRIQLFAELSRPAKFTWARNPDVSDQARRQTGVGVRFMGELASSPGWYYELGGMFDASSNYEFNGTSGGTYLNLTDVKVTDSYWTVGAAYMGRVSDSLTWGVHLEGRGEYLRIQGEVDSNLGSWQLDQATTYLRPWVRGSFDYTFTSIGTSTHPYIGLEGSYALLRTSQLAVPDPNNFDNRNLKSMAPRASAAIYAGLRF